MCVCIEFMYQNAIYGGLLTIVISNEFMTRMIKKLKI